MQIKIFRNCCLAVIRVTIDTIIFACIIHTNVNAGKTSTFFSLILIFACCQLTSQQLFEQNIINTMPMLYSTLFQIYFFRTGFQYDSIFFAITESCSAISFIFFDSRGRISNDFVLFRVFL